MHSANVEIVIVGGGVGGLSAAMRLQVEGVPASEIVVVDGDLGGRLQTCAIEGGPRLETGAGRYNRSLHPRLDRLVGDLDLDLDPFRFDVRYSVSRSPEDALGGVDLGTLPAAGSFFAALAGRIGIERADEFCSATGYEALRDRRFPVAGGVDIVATHPECGTEPDRHAGWVSPRDGFGELVRRLADRVEGSGVRIERATRLTAVREDDVGVTLVLERGDHAVRDSLRARRLVLAVPPSELPAIDLPVALADQPWWPHLVTIPLFKGFLVYDAPWWDELGLRQTCLITANRLQKLYFDSNKRCIFFYCDSGNSVYWNQLRARGERHFIDRVHQAIQGAVGVGMDAALGTESAAVAHFWPSGITYLDHQSKGTQRGVVEMTDRIVLASDTFTDMPGWIEGVLVAADTVAIGARAQPGLLATA